MKQNSIIRKDRLLSSLLVWAAGYLIGTTGGFLMLLLFRQALRNYSYYVSYGGYWENVVEGVVCFVIGLLVFSGGVTLVCIRSRKRAERPLKRGYGLYGMPLELCILTYVLAEVILCFVCWTLGYDAGMLGFVLMAAGAVHFCSNMEQRRQRGTLWSNSFAEKISRAAADAGLVLPFMAKCTLLCVLLMLFLVFLVWNGRYNLYSGPAVLLGIFALFAAAVGIPVLIWYLCWSFYRLQQAGEELAQGHDGYRLDTRRLCGAMKRHGENLNSIGEGVNRAVEAKLKSERLKTDLITNVSHDIKTPLTSIINYADLISKEESENPSIQEYAQVLGKQSQKLKRLIENLIEASKASTGNIKMDLRPCNLNVLLAQMVGEYEKRLEEQHLTLVMTPMDQELFVMADGSQLWRVFDNLMGNICKYALEGTRVYLEAEVHEQVTIILKNISRQQLNLTEEELMERFTRGDESRSTVGNGLGLSIAQSLMKLQNGSLHLVIDGDLFKAVVCLEPCKVPAEAVSEKAAGGTLQ